MARKSKPVPEEVKVALPAQAEPQEQLQEQAQAGAEVQLQAEAHEPADTQTRLQVPEESVVVQTALPTLLERVGDFIAEKGWTSSSYPDKGYMTLNLRLSDGTTHVVLDTAEGAGLSRLLVYTRYPTFVPLLRRPAVAEAIARINYANIFGNFEMDMADGELRVRTVLESDVFLGDEMIDRTLSKCLDLADQYQAPLLAIAFGNASPADVLEVASAGKGATLQ